MSMLKLSVGAAALEARGLANASASEMVVEGGAAGVQLDFDGRTVNLTNLLKPFWPELGITKGDLLQYYADVSNVLLPHLWV